MRTTDPIHESPLWSLIHDYYQDKGILAWSEDIPFQATNHSGMVPALYAVFKDSQHLILPSIGMNWVLVMVYLPTVWHSTSLMMYSMARFPTPHPAMWLFGSTIPLGNNTLQYRTCNKLFHR